MLEIVYVSPVLTEIGKIAVFLLMTTAVVSLHEFGHFVLARYYGVHVKTFAVGFGRKLFAVQSRRSGTTYQVNVLPMGGYCRLKATDEGSSLSDGDSGLAKVSPIWVARSFDTDSLEFKPPLERLAIMVAGPIVSFLIAIPLLIFAYAVLGTVAPTVTRTAPSAPAARAGIQAGDRVAAVKIGGKSVDVTSRWWISPTGPAVVTYRHGAISRTVVLTPVDRRNRGFSSTKTFGIEVKVISHRLSLGDAVLRSGQSFASIWQTTWAGIGGVILRPSSAMSQFSGPIGLAESSGKVQDYGWGSYFTFAAVVSISLGIFNVLPIPGLDGGQIAFVVVELLRGGKRLSVKRQQMVTAGGVAVLIVLIGVTTFHDIGLLLSHHKV